ncbi:Cytochrome P450 [Rhizobiales bacterium GAS191]|nr:Cytochrome P450 [Rhizobiales bacterium GAS113]SEC08743.1 Cytochrome P450 [Rhizobiales bacterium GAS191]
MSTRIDRRLRGSAGNAPSPGAPPAPRPREKPLGAFGLLKGLRDNPITNWTRRHYEEGVVLTRSIIGVTCLVSDPAAIRHVLVDNAGNYHKGVLQTRVLRPGLGNGLLTAEGESWRQQRRALAPAFTPRLIEGFQPAMASAAEALVVRWLSLEPGSRLDVAREMPHVTLEVLERTIFSDGLASEPATLAEAVTRYLDTLGRVHPFDALDLPAFLPRFGRRDGLDALGTFNGAIERIIARRRALLAQGRQAPRDLLALLLEAEARAGAFGNDEVRANIATFIAAGHETTANALVWSLFLLSFAPRWRERVEAEVDEVLGEGDLAACRLDRLVLTKAVLEEALRLYPPAAIISRQPIGKDVIGGHEVDHRTRVVISPWVLHRHRRLWQAPDDFDPTRFLPRARAEIDRFAYLPFGAGPRLCIGAAFALQEAIIVIAAIMRRFRLELAPGHQVVPVQRVTLRPRGGLPMLLSRR